jgi:tetratricopeptide (TPR) repeat protein
MAFNLTRMTVYALLSSIEEDLRTLIKMHISDILLINPELTEKAKFRIKKDVGIIFGDLGVEDIVDYFDLGDTFQVINANRELFPRHISDFIKSLTSKLEILIPIRNRVMHIRPLSFDDYPTVTSFTECLINECEEVWSNTKQTLEKINSDPSFVLSLEIKNYENDDVVSHNLPLPDFDETGLIGRDDEVKQIKDLCLGGFPVISIVGEGGVGKTALALKVAYELIEDKRSSFDAVVWVSSKTTQISVNEIKEIRGAINSSLGVIQEISEQIIGDASETENLEEIVEYLATFKIVLFIDNLETILDDNIRKFVSALPQGSKIVITSRIGLGAYEYPVKLKGIDESYASQLLRSISKLRNVETLYKLDENILRKYVNRMHCNPSYIKWFVSSVQTGLNPEYVLQHSDVFLNFCMSNVYEYLSSEARQLTSSLQCAPGLKDIPELAYLNDFDSLCVQKTIQELMATNMLSQASKTKGASVKTTYQLSELARAYLGKYHKPTQGFQKSIQSKRNKLNSLFEQQKARKYGNKYSPRNIQFRDKSDRVIVKMLHDAQKYIGSGMHDKAFEVLQEAHRLSPDYFEVARFLAYFYHKIGNLHDAREQYELALLLAPNTAQLHYWFGKFILHEEENVDESVVQFKKALEIDSDSIEVSLALARGYLYQHNFNLTKQILDGVKPVISSADDHLYKMYLDTDLQIHCRLADDLSDDGDCDGALRSLEAMKRCFDDLEENDKDRHIRQKLNKANYTLKRLACNMPSSDQDRVKSLENWINLESLS